ncbi:S-layer homology domain-containing protein [Bacillaceae bacterium S4-13-56]
MKNLRKVGAGFLVFIFTMNLVNPVNATSVEPVYVNPPVEEIKQLITETANKHNIPPEIMKAIAFNETAYKQFDDAGQPIISPDGGIGMMQVTPDNIDTDLLVDEQKLKTDIAYNIEIAAQVLNKKWSTSFLPQINGGERNVLENWYFAVMAYNGLAKQNDPNFHPDTAYQSKIYKRLGGHSFIVQEHDYFLFPKFDINYKEGSSIMAFPEKDYKTNVMTSSQQMYNVGDTVYINGRDGVVNFREGSITGSPTKQLSHNTELTITGAPIETEYRENDYVYYPVATTDEVEGYVASAYLTPEPGKLFEFPDLLGYRTEITYLAERKIINGYTDGTFGPDQTVSRTQAVVMILRTLGVDYQNSNAPDPGFTDVSPATNEYKAIAEAVSLGFISGKENNTFDPAGKLTRGQMAKILVKAFELTGESDKTFTDVAAPTDDSDGHWAYDYISTLAANKITTGYPNGTFLPQADISRQHFALFIYRYLN